MKNDCSVSFRLYEILQYLFAAILVGVTFVIAYEWNLLLGLFLGSLGLIVHELGHKIMGSVRCIDDVHFTISPVGIAIGFGAAIFFGQAFAAPGGVTVGDNATEKDRLWMALAGPYANFILFGLGLAMYLVYPVSVTIGGQTVDAWIAFSVVNLYLGVFNLIPIPMFDGSYVYAISKWAWLSAISIPVLAGLVMIQSLDVVQPLYTSRGGVFGLFVGFMIPLNQQLQTGPGFLYSVVDRDWEVLN